MSALQLAMLYLSILFALFAAKANAKQDRDLNLTPPPFKIQVAVLRTFGSGCPQGSVVATLSPDQTSVSLMFDQLSTDLPGSSVLVNDLKQCYVTLGIQFSGQYRVAIVGTDVRGFVSVPAGASSTITVNHRSIYASQKHHKKMAFVQSFNGPVEQNVEMFSRFHDIPMWSQCGTQMRYNTQIFPFMTVNIEIQSQQRNANENLLAAIDSLDFSTNAPLSYQLAWTRDTKSCPK